MQTFTKKQICVGAALVLLIAAACAPAAPSPTVAPAKPAEAAKPAATAVPAKPTPAPAAKPVPTAAPAKPVASLAAKPAASPVTKASFDEKAVADFYRGKTVKIVVGLAAGGGYDTFARIIAKHMPRHLPGSPTMIVENRVGAGSLVAANTVYKADPKDGTVLVNFNENMVLQQALGAQGIEFDARKYQWLGSLEKGQPACVIRADRGAKSMQDLMAGKELAIGTQGPGSYSHSVPRALQEALGANIKIVPGYGGTSQMRLAMEQGETDGGCWTWSTMRPAVQEWLEGSNPFAKILVIMGKTAPNDPYLKDTPAAETLAKTDEARQLLGAVNAPTEMTKPYAVAPGVPSDRVAALRAAFDATMKDTGFIEEIKKAKLELGYSAAPEVEKTVSELLSLPPAVQQRVKQVIE